MANRTENGAARRRLSGPEAVRQAKAHLAEMTGRECESVSALARTEAGWAVTVEVVELERIPRTTDLLASYVVEIDDAGELAGYERLSRYARGQMNSE